MKSVTCRMGPTKYILSFFILVLFQQSFSQTYYYFEITFKDKGNTYSTSSPSAFLSEQSIQKKIKRNIAVDFSDLPLNVQDIKSLGAYTDSVTHRSKWRNSVLIKITDTSKVQQIRNLGNVKSAQFFTSNLKTSKKKEEGQTKFSSQMNVLTTYGNGYNQIAMIGGHFLHERGFKGEGMDIAIFDAGFEPYNFSVVDELNSEGRIKYTWNFVDNNDAVFQKHTHGSMVLSVMAHNNKKIVGAAPQANYHLFLTEDVNSESLLEEYNWLMAAEIADSIGIDVINSSLGYSVFDDTTTNHKYSDMDGNTTLVTKAANMAVRKGMLVVASAGNEGSEPWHYIVSPADGDSVLAVGAVDAAEKYAFFSSTGPAADGAVKPNVATQGLNSVITFYQNNYTTGNGTSFAGPLMAAAGACLWQAFPQLSNLELKKEIEKCASQYNYPDSLLGFGIPDLVKAFMNLDSTDQFDYNQSLLISMRTNPFTDNIGLELYTAEKQELNFKLIDITGRLIREENQSVEDHQYVIFGLGDLQGISSGVYFFIASDDNGFSEVYKVVKE